MSTLVDIAVRSSVVLLAGLAMTSCLAGRSAALRHWVLAVAIFAAAAVAPLSLAMPGWQVAIPVWEGAGLATLPPVGPSAGRIAPVAPAGTLPHVDVIFTSCPDHTHAIRRLGDRRWCKRTDQRV